MVKVIDQRAKDTSRLACKAQNVVSCFHYCVAYPKAIVARGIDHLSGSAYSSGPSKTEIVEIHKTFNSFGSPCSDQKSLRYRRDVVYISLASFVVEKLSGLYIMQ